MKRILVVDDIQENRYLLEVLLKGYDYEVMSATNGAEALEVARRSPPDLIVSDILMPVMDGYALCREWKADPALVAIPFIFYTATYTEPEDEEFALSLGAERFVIKPQEPEKLVKIVAEVFEQCAAALQDGGFHPVKPEDEFLHDYNRALFRKLEKKLTDVERLNRSLSCEIAERKKLEEIVFRCEVQLHNILDASSVAMTWSDKQGRMLYVNREFSNFFGYQLDELPLVETWFSAAYPDVIVRRSMMQAWRNAPDAADCGSMKMTPVEVRVLCKGGAIKHVSVVEAVVSDIHLTTFHDLTEQRTLVSQLLQAQKMESFGHLAGGIVHDFNNILTAIVGYGHLLMTKLPPEGPSRTYVEQILSVSDRGAKITRSIFDFSRKQTMEEKPVKLNQVVSGAENLLNRLVRECVALKIELCPEDMTILADPGQLEQVLMNLVTNANDAIDGTGTITINTATSMLDDETAQALGSGAKGPCALLTVSDTGQGIDEKTRNSIFEPFFTTKESGKGTGLGLSVVYGIVRRHKGHIIVQSEPGKGTRFSIYFPALDILRDHDETTS